MSIISNVHSIINYTSGVTKPLSGQRLASVSFKTDKATGIKPESKAVSLPVIYDAEIIESIQGLLPAIGKLVQDSQDEILRDAVLNGRTEIAENEIGLSAVISYLNAVATGNRLTKEKLNDWFDEIAMPVLSVAIAQKVGITDIDLATEKQVKLVSDTLETYKDKLSALSSGRTKYETGVISALTKALNLIIATGDKTASVLLAKLEDMSKKPTIDLLAL